LQNEIVNLCNQEDADIIILAEYREIDFQNFTRCYPDFFDFYERIQIDDKSRVVMLKKRRLNISVIYESNYFSAYKIKNTKIEVLIFGLHLPSQLYNNISELNTHAGVVLRDIQKIEQEHDNFRSIIIGDFNLNPFDEGMISATGFNSVMCPNIAQKISRKHLHVDYPFYYNPMWGLMGRFDSKIKGTYYYDKGVFWNTFDQILLNPSLINCFTSNDIYIIENINNISLINTRSFRPNNKDFSDHLPIKINLNLEELI